MHYPLLFSPIYKDYIWGGDRIPREYGRDEPAGVYAESWEIADRPEGMSVVANGECAGTSLHELVVTRGSELLGASGAVDRFPLLIKIIDSKQSLSVQVHPHDRDVDSVGGEAKTEMWYVLAADSGARVFAGLKSGVDRQQFEVAIADERADELLSSVPVKAGDAIYIPGGRVHAIDSGCLLLEVQQNSNTTYRVFDWGRLGNDGKPRPLHIEEALKVIDWNDAESALVTPGEPMGANGSTVAEIVSCPYFKVERLEISSLSEVHNDGQSFHAYFTTSGSVTVDTGEGVERTGPGASCLIAACVSNYTLLPEDGAAQMIRVSTP